MSMLELELKQLIIDALDLEDVEVEDIDSNEPLFVEGLGLDSIDALELGVALQKKFQVKMESNSEANKEHFASVANLTKFIEKNRSK
jgi:acyl carrier protein